MVKGIIVGAVSITLLYGLVVGVFFLGYTLAQTVAQRDPVDKCQESYSVYSPDHPSQSGTFRIPCIDENDIEGYQLETYIVSGDGYFRHGIMLVPKLPNTWDRLGLGSASVPGSIGGKYSRMSGICFDCDEDTFDDDNAIDAGLSDDVGWILDSDTLIITPGGGK